MTTTGIQVCHQTIIRGVTDSQLTLPTTSEFKSNKDIKIWLCQQPGLKGLGTDNIWLATWDHDSTTLTKLTDGDRPPAPRHNYVSAIRMIVRLRGGGPGASGNMDSQPTVPVTEPDSTPLLGHDKRPDYIHMDSLRTIWATYANQNPGVTIIYPVLSDSDDNKFMHIDYIIPVLNFYCPTWCSQRMLNDGAIGFESDGEFFAFETGGPEDSPDECLIPEEDGFGCIDGGDGEVAGLQGGADGYGVDGDIDHGEQLCGAGDVSGCSLSSVGEDDEGADLAGGFFGESVLEESDGIGGCGQQFTAFGLQLLCELQWCGLQLFGGEQSEIEREIFAEIFEELRGSGGEQSAGEFGAGHLIEFAE